jgi:tocopherol O-methyltransferase
MRNRQSSLASAGSRRPYLEAVRAYYNETWKDYRGAWMNRRNRAIHFGYWTPSTRTHAASLIDMNRVLASRVGLRPGEHVLDAGCGVGGSAMWLAEEYGARVIGITLVGDQVERARRYSNERGLGHLVAFEQQDYLRTSFPDATFDVVWAQESLCHAPDKRAFFVEAHRVLKPGGRLVVEEYLRFRECYPERDERLLHSWFTGWMIPNLLTGEQALRCARDVGFVDVALEDLTPQVRRSLRRLYRIVVGFYPVVYPLYLLGCRSQVQHGNARGSRDQWRASKRGLWFIAILTARKPDRETW